MPCTCTSAGMIYICTVKINPPWCLNHPSLARNSNDMCMYSTSGVLSVTGVGLTLVPFIGVCVSVCEGSPTPDTWTGEGLQPYSTHEGERRSHMRVRWSGRIVVYCAYVTIELYIQVLW